MKLIDKNGRLFGRISIIDVLVVLVVALLAVVLNTKSDLKQITTDTQDQPITYQVKVNAIPNYMAEALKVGDDVYEDGAVTGGSLGRITDIQASDGTRLATLFDGSLEMVPVEDTVDLLVTVEGRGVVNEEGFLLNNIYHLGFNSSRNFCTPYTQFTGTVANIEK